ncbi:MAG: tetratricopeptide repeat protein [Thermoanaerobaculia bacterium]|nr:tetratricopeptide repeat protein [Thermoanaerobaculia bacterium]
MSNLSVIQPKTRIRPSRNSQRRAIVLILVHLAIAAHITHWLVTGRTATPIEPSEAAALASAGVVNTGLVFFAVTIVLTAVFGRFFCGWACHVVALQDLARSLLAKFGRRPKPLRSRLLRWVPVVAFVYAFLWPAIYRWVMQQPMPALRTEFTTTEFWATFPGWIVATLTFLICGFLAVYFLGAKGFCAYACPYGAIFGAVERLSPLRVRVTDACRGCGHCTAVCTSNVRVHEEVRDFGMVVDSGCMKCLDCVSVCPQGALYYGAGPLPLGAKPRAEGRKMTRFPLSWKEEGVLAFACVAGFFTFRGLYGQVPFLMALGLAGVLAYLALLCFQLVTRPNLAFKGWRLKRGGVLQLPAFVLLGAMALLTLVWIHSAVVRFHTYRGDAGYRSAKVWRSTALDITSPRPRLAADDQRRLVRGLAAFEKVRRLGWIDSRGLDAKMAWQAALLGHDGEMELHALAALEKGELQAEMHQLLGRRAFEAEELSRAATHFELAVAEGSHDSQARTNLGVVLAQSGRLDDARVVFEEAVREFGTDVALAYNLGLVEAYAGRPDVAAAHFSRAVELNPRHLPARENLAGTLAAMGRYEESVDQYLRSIEQSPEDPETRVLLARVLAALGRYEEALEQNREALRLAPDLPAARRLQADLSNAE